tara:strand:- start:527 stop:913 length:387 start_codon:yes stop_codon:yes gene_type:complete
MAIDYGMPDNGFTVGGGSMGQMPQGMPDAAMLVSILGDLTAKITVETEEIPDDYSGVPKKTKTVEEIDLAELMPGPAPIALSTGAAPPPPMMGGMPQMPRMAQMPRSQQQMPGGMGVQAAQSVMRQFG